MLCDVIFEALRFLDRDDLDACQLASKWIRKFIDGSPTLVLRSITQVDVVSNAQPIGFSGLCRDPNQSDELRRRSKKKASTYLTLLENTPWALQSVLIARPM